MAAESKGNYDYLKYISDRNKGVLPKVEPGLTLYHSVTLEEFINMTFTDALKSAGMKPKTNPYGEKGFFTLLMEYAKDLSAPQEEIVLKDGTKQFVTTKPNIEVANDIFNELKDMPVHQFFNNGQFSSLGEFVKQNNYLASIEKDRTTFAQSIFTTINTGVNEFNKSPLKIDKSIVEKLVEELKNPRKARVVPFIVSNRLTGVASPAKSFDIYMQGIDDYINENQLASINKNLTKVERLKAKTEVSMAKAAKAKFLLMMSTGFRVGEASSIYRYDPTALTDVNGLNMQDSQLAFKNTHFSTFSQLYDKQNDIYRYKIFIPKNITKTSAQIYVDIPEFVGKALVDQAIESTKLKTRSLFAYKDYTTGKVIDSYNYKTGAITGKIDNFLFGDSSPLTKSFSYTNIAMGYNVDKRSGATSIKAHDIRRMFSTMIRSYIDSDAVEEGQKRALSEAADMFQGRRASLPSAEFRYGSVETPYAGGGATFRLANQWSGDELLPNSAKLQLINSIKEKVLDPNDFNNNDINQSFLRKEETGGAIADSVATTTDDTKMLPAPVEKKAPTDMKELRSTAIRNIDNYAEKKAFLNMTMKGTDISFEDALKEYNSIIEAQSTSTKTVKDKIVDTIKKPSVKGTALGLVGAVGSAGLLAGAAKVLPFVGAGAGAASAAEISMRPDEEFKVEGSFLSPNVRKALKAGTAQFEGISPVPTDLSLLNLLPGEQNFRPLNEILFPTQSEIQKQKELAEKSATQLENYQDDRTTIKDSTETQMNNLFK
jgi:hypothetical protein